VAEIKSRDEVRRPDVQQAIIEFGLNVLQQDFHSYSFSGAVSIPPG
jgi:hypothetical protein